MIVCDNPACYHALIKADLRISVKDFHRNKNLKMLFNHAVFAARRQFYVRMNGSASPKDGRPVSLTKLLAGLRKALVKAA